MSAKWKNENKKEEEIMPKYGQNSMTQLNTLKQDIQTIMHEVIKVRDCSIVEGQRTAERQHEHWQKGRQLIKQDADPKVRANWKVVDQSKVVTTKDGYEKKSIHQEQPKSGAVDVIPWPEKWSSKIAFAELRGVIKAVQARLLAEGRITTTLQNGYDLWDGWDEPHWQEAK